MVLLSSSLNRSETETWWPKIWVLSNAVCEQQAVQRNAKSDHFQFLMTSWKKKWCFHIHTMIQNTKKQITSMKLEVLRKAFMKSFQLQPLCSHNYVCLDDFWNFFHQCAFLLYMLSRQFFVSLFIETWVTLCQKLWISAFFSAMS